MEWARYLNEPFTKEDIETANKKHEKHLPSLSIRGVIIKTTIFSHYQPTRMANIKPADLTSVGKDMEKLELFWWV